MSNSSKLELSVYEKNAILAIHAWKNPELHFYQKVMAQFAKPFNMAGDAVMGIPGVDIITEKIFLGIISLINDASTWSVRPDAIFKEFSPPVESFSDIQSLDLENVDKTIGYLAAKYKGLAFAQGAGAGALNTVNPVVGGAAIAADVISLVAMNFRAIGEYATYCGFDIKKQEERLFIFNVLGLASSPTDAGKAVAMANLVKIASDVAKKRTWKQLEEQVFVQLVQKIAKSLSIRLTKAKLAQIIPVAGAVVGGGFNAYYTSEVCEAANFLYRERFLAEKYGPNIIEITVNPSSDFGKGYGDE